MTDTILLPRSQAIFGKVHKDRSISHNLIYTDAGRDATTTSSLGRSRTSKIEFRTELYSELQQMTMQKYYLFQSKVMAIEESKKRLERRKMAHTKKIEESVAFIEENQSRYKRTMHYMKHDAKTLKMKADELTQINNEVEQLHKKKTFYLQANINLKKYENFLLDALGILPHDYVKGLKENNMTALLRRYTSLFFMNKLLYEDLNQSSDMIRKLIIDLDMCHYELSCLQSHQSVVVPSLNNRHLEVENELSVKSTEHAENYNSMRSKLHCLGVLLLAVNNVTNKAFQILEKGFSCDLDLNLIPKILNLDPDTKFMRIEEFISCALQILELVESKQAILV